MSLYNSRWVNPLYVEVEDAFVDQVEKQGKSDRFASAGILIWEAYTEKKRPMIKNPTVAAAALHYLVDQLYWEEHTKKSVSELYGVPVKSIASRYQDISNSVEDVIEEIHRDLHVPRGIQVFDDFMTELGIDLLAEEALKIAMKKKVKRPTKRNREEARQLLDKAYNVEGFDCVDLAKQAIKLDRYNLEAYTIIANEVATIELSIELLKLGMEIGEETLGESFFEENIGRIWEIDEARPFMRLKSAYARYLIEEDSQEAIKQFEELLELDPKDHQKVRNELMEVYFITEDIPKVKNLLGNFQEDTAHCLYNLVLVEYLENGSTPELKKLIIKAKKQNRYVVNYLTQRNPLPETLPEHYSVGDLDEAKYYSYYYIEFWEDHPELLELLK